MNSKQLEIALAAPVFDPLTQIGPHFGWWHERARILAMLTCNIGME